MHARTTTAVALAGTALALPAAAHAADAATEPPSPDETALRAPVAGHLTLGAQMRAARAHDRRVRLSATATRLARRVAAERDHEFRRAHFRARLRGDGASTLRARVRGLRHDLKAARSRGEVSTPGYLAAIAACESGGNPAADTGNGFYGKYQFTLSTWQSVGGSGNPAAAPEAEQDRRAAALYAQQGSSPWPVCGR
jgi:Transglycosylase-like domain